MSRPAEYLVAVLVTVFVTTMLLTLGSAAVATRWDCGAWPAPSGFTSGFDMFLGRETRMATEGGCHPAEQTAWITLIAVLVLVVFVGLLITVWWARYRASDKYFIKKLRARRGFAGASELQRALTSKAVRRRAKTLRPDVGKKAKATDVAWKVGTARGVEVFVSIEDSVIVIGPPRSGKGFRFVINAILDWPGPLITTSTRNDNLAATMAMREKVGRVTVFDPQRLSGVRSTTKISPLTGCENAMVATQRADALVNGSGLSKSGENAVWAGEARKILARLLLAAAVDGRDVTTLARWGSSPSQAEEAIEILENAGPRGWAQSLSSVIHDDDDKLRGNKWFGVSGAIEPLEIPEIAEAMTPRDGDDVFDPDDFLNGRNTLYLIGTKSGAGAAGGYLAALLDDIVEQARRRALSMPNSRLSPPLGLILDEIANIFTWPALPTVMADGGGVGISPLVVLQARSQAETAWSRAEMDSVFSSATAKMLLGGSGDVSLLRDLEALLGTHQEDRRSHSWNEQGTSVSVQKEKLALMTPEELRRMPTTIGLLIYRNIRPVVLDLDAWIERRDAKHVKRGKKATEQAQREVFIEQNVQRRAERRGEMVETSGD
ncbi:type IV secretory system conjugative DNA transfer family protein [Microbacterium amylolyticum]|uniref:Type IV secretory pathway TraG/TraD family ATPase VirD4 n=1 Tax=Microbacterium amylolyticum TaxID=936337 RepID=A0ABS4ZKT9_9MICO|nr:type IV secretory system conjugative DNA transfer family protein [Microbacterium amylolyticum]MBP2437907.1 type IV secretory pathway TraG/TraD family ATPase VirD4 [Microbacterium amylolyticum]